MCAVYLIIYHNYNNVIYFSVKIGREIVCKTYERSPLNSGSNSDIKSPPVILETMFGLGNQLFQYAASYSIARRRNSDLYICLKRSDVPLSYQNVSTSIKSNSYDRSYGLGMFKIPHDKLLIKPDDGSSVPCESLLSTSNNLLFTANDEAVVKCEIPPDRMVKINGFFESEIFFHQYKEELLEMFVLDNEEALEKETEEILRQIEETESICVHVRRGDFANDKARKLPDSYYVEAMTLIEEKLAQKPNRTFFVFSDDITSVTEDFQKTINIDKKHDVVFVSNGNFSRFHDLFLMTKCKNLIMANSTFSWWAAYLNRYNDKIVIAPIPKFKDTYNYWNHPYGDLVKKLQYYWAYPTSYLIIKPNFI